jgi:hypothetical protein
MRSTDDRPVSDVRPTYRRKYVKHVNLSLSRACVLAVALGGATASCTFNPSAQIGAGGPDGSIEPRPDADPLRPDARLGAPDASVPPDARPGCETWTPRPTHFESCDLPAPLGPLTLEMAGEYVYDTDAVTLLDPQGNQIAHASVELSGNPPVRVVSVDRLLVGNVARLRAVGSKPLLVASWSEIVVEGAIDVSSNAVSGAGASTGDCTPSGAGGQDNEGGGGGGGGGLGGNGGKGGNGADGGGGGGNAGGTMPTPGTVRGGCPGARGGIGNGGDGSGAGGAGGGALQLTARSRIDIRGQLHGGGAGGQGGRCPQGNRSGAGGGGSGGLLDLEAPTIAFGPDAIVAANGGGGGEGCQGGTSDSGGAGQASDDRAQGAIGSSTSGGDGGDGSAGSNLDGTDGGNGTAVVFDRGSGGGGGGGAGYIIIEGVESVSNGAVLSPPSTKR